MQAHYLSWLQPGELRSAAKPVGLQVAEVSGDIVAAADRERLAAKEGEPFRLRRDIIPDLLIDLCIPGRIALSNPSVQVCRKHSR